MFIIHAGGKINYHTYTNSKESIINILEFVEKFDLNEIFIEVDVIKIKDEFVIAHNCCEKSIYGLDKNFNEINFNEYKKLKVYNKYTPLDFYILKEIILLYPKAKFILDIKEHNKEYDNCLNYIKNILNDNINKIIPQIYYENELDYIINNNYERVLFASYNFDCAGISLINNRTTEFIKTINNSKIELFGISIHIKNFNTEDFLYFIKNHEKEKIYFHGQNEHDEHILYEKVQKYNCGLFSYKIMFKNNINNKERIDYYTSNINKKWILNFEIDTETIKYIDNNISINYNTPCVEQYGTYNITNDFDENKYKYLFEKKIMKLDKEHTAYKNFINIMNYDNNSYIKPILKIKNKHNYYKNGSFLIRPGDVYFNVPFPIICKTRPLKSINQYKEINNFLINLDYERHWKNPLDNVNKYDISFKNKNNKLIWRGSPNGLIVQKLYNRPNRLELCKKHENNENENIDIGFVYDYKDIKGKKLISIDNLLKSKFLISVEGGDVATNLKWILYSNSVPFMPKPTVCSWLMEDKLIPWFHYIPINNDFSDINEKYNWCLNNLDKCEDISKNGKEYINQFLDIKNEEILEFEVLKKFIDNVEINEI